MKKQELEEALRPFDRLAPSMVELKDNHKPLPNWLTGHDVFAFVNDALELRKQNILKKE